MEITLKEEVQLVFVCLLSGILTGVLYDLFRIIRKCTKPSVVIVFIEDLLFWILDALLVFYALYTACGGQLRWFYLPCIITGFAIYHFTVSRLFVRTGFFVVRISLNVTSGILRFVLFPLRILLKFALLVKKSFKKSKFFKKIRKIRLTYRNFCFKIKKSIHKIYCILLRR